MLVLFDKSIESGMPQSGHDIVGNATVIDFALAPGTESSISGIDDFSSKEDKESILPTMVDGKMELEIQVVDR